MSNIPVINPGGARSSAERPSDYAATAAYYVTRTSNRPAKQGGKSTVTSAVTTEALRSGSGEADHPVNHELAFKGATASLYHTAEVPSGDATTKKFVTEEETKFSRAGSRAALKTVRERTETIEAKEAVPEDTYGSEQAARLASAGATSRSHAKPPSIQEETPDLAHALTAATLSQRTSRVEPEVPETREPLYNPAKVHQVALARAQQNFATPPPSRQTTEGVSGVDTSHAAAVRMAKQMYAVMPQAQDLAAAETSTDGSAYDQVATTSDYGRPVNLMSEAERRVKVRLAQIDGEQGSMRIHQPGRASPRPTSMASRRRRFSVGSDAETGSITRGRRVPFARYSLREEPGAAASSQDDTALMQTARRNVDNTLSQIDQNLYMYAGRPSPAVLREWDRKLDERQKLVKAPPTAQLSPATGSRFGDNPQVREKARTRLQPTLNAIDDEVNEKRAREIEKKLDAAHQKDVERIQRERELETSKLHSMLFRPTKTKGSKAEKQREAEDVEEHGEDEERRVKEEKKAEKDAERMDKTDKKAEKKAEKEAEKAEKEAEKAEKKAEKEAHKAEKASKKAEKEAEKAEMASKKAEMETEKAEKKLEKKSHKKEEQAANEPNGIQGASTGPVIPQTEQPSTSVEPGQQEMPEPLQKPAEPAAQLNGTAGEPNTQTTPRADHVQHEDVGFGGVLSQWSTSNDGDAARSRGPQQNPSSKRSPKRFSLKNIFSRPASRDTGKQGSFQVQRPAADSAAQDAVEGPQPTVVPPYAAAAAAATEARPQSGTGHRVSRFQEDL